MKTTFKTMTNIKTAIKKRKAFQEKTGLKWDYYHTGNGMRFTPIVTKDTPICFSLAKQLLPHLTTEYKEFIFFSNSKIMPLKNVLIAAKTLLKNKQAVGTVNRVGNFYAIRKKHSWEK